MESQKSKLDIFFATLDQLITSGFVKRGKDFRLVEEPNGKVLYLHMESIHPKYQFSMGNAEFLPLIDLRAFMERSSAFVKYKSIFFQWNEPINDSVYTKHSVNVCAVMLCYETLKKKYNIDFEKYNVEEFEAALRYRKVEIDEIILKPGRYVYKSIGYINGQKHIWKSDGKCFSKNGTPNQRYNLKFE